jgi:hypothetical protein
MDIKKGKKKEKKRGVLMARPALYHKFVDLDEGFRPSIPDAGDGDGPFSRKLFWQTWT